MTIPSYVKDFLWRTNYISGIMNSMLAVVYNQKIILYDVNLTGYVTCKWMTILLAISIKILFPPSFKTI